MNELLIEKIQIIKNCLKRIKDTTQLKIESLDNNYDIQDIFVINLQRAIQATFDIANIIIKDNQLELPKNYKDSFEILFKNNIITEQIKEKMVKMAGFRNIAVHDYQTINVEILKSILKSHLSDFQDFYKQL